MLKIKNPVFDPCLYREKNTHVVPSTLNGFLKTALQNVYELYWYHPLIEMFIRLKKTTNPRVLDIGYHHGFSTAWLMIASDSVHVNAIDTSSSTALMMKRLLRSVAPDVELSIINSSAESLPFRDNTFDIIFCRSVLQYTDTERVCKEIRRVLCPDGQGFIIANMSENPFVRLYRKKIGRSKKEPFGAIQGYLSIETIHHWTEEKWLKFHREFHFFMPLLFPVIERISSGVLKRIVFFGSAYIDRLCTKMFPFLNRYSWLTFMEIGK